MNDPKYDLNEVLETSSVGALEQAARGATWVYSRGALGVAVWPFTAYLAAACLSEVRRRRDALTGEGASPRPRVLPMPGSLPKKPEARRVLLSAAREVVAVMQVEAEQPQDEAEEVSVHEVSRIFAATLEVFEIVLAEAELEASTVQ